MDHNVHITFPLDGFPALLYALVSDTSQPYSDGKPTLYDSKHRTVIVIFAFIIRFAVLFS